MNPLEIARGIRPEVTAFGEAIRFGKKDPSKLKLIVGLYALSIKGVEDGHVTRLSYFAMRNLDDLLDGELTHFDDPKTYAQGVRRQIETGLYNPDDPIAGLISRAIPLLDRSAKDGDNPKGEFIRLIDAMIVDHDRRVERRALPDDELSRNYASSIEPGINVLLMGLGSGLRAADIPTFAVGLSRAYSIRDLQKDWDLGIINVPQEWLDVLGLNATLSYRELMSDRIMQGWRVDEIREATRQLLEAKDVIDRVAEPIPCRILSGLIGEAVKSAHKTVENSGRVFYGL